MIAVLALCGTGFTSTSRPVARRDSGRLPMYGVQMQMSAGQNIDGVRVGPPPDLPSLLLNNRIVYVGAPLVPQVAELVVAQLLYLNYESQEKSVYMYINSPGTGAFETDAFAIADTMNYVGPEMETICIGSAFGTAAMLLANGAKGKRSCLPNATIMLAQPRSQARGQATDIQIKAREVLTARKTISAILAEKTGQPIDKVSHPMCCPVMSVLILPVGMDTQRLACNDP